MWDVLCGCGFTASWDLYGKKWNGRVGARPGRKFHRLRDSNLGLPLLLYSQCSAENGEVGRSEAANCGSYRTGQPARSGWQTEPHKSV
jgi:hypothetical protein